MTEAPSQPGLFWRLLPILAVVTLILLGVRFWLSGGSSAGSTDPGKKLGQPGAGPDELGFMPEPGSYILETQVLGEAPRRLGIQISKRAKEKKEDGDSFRLSQNYQLPEPTFETAPDILRPHLGKIRMKIDIDSEGHILDVTGPDDYFDELDEREPGMSDAIRALLLEEQIDAELAWKITPVVSQPATPGRTWTHEVHLAELGGDDASGTKPGWKGVLRYTMGDPVDCGPAAPDEQCFPVTIATDESSSGGEELKGTLWVGGQTGLTWSAEFERTRGGLKRHIESQLRRR